jgi:fucose 4-O-acetylase-like acetyltransferase
MELDRDSSARLDLIRFPLIVGVVIEHAYKSGFQFGSTEVALRLTNYGLNFVNSLISGGLAFIAVPLFFFMSGFLFFYSLEWSRAAFFQKVRSRIKTLLVPFLFWNLLVFVVYVVAQNIPITAQYFAGGIPHITQSGVFEYFNLIIGINRYPVAFQFWFIRDLMILVAITPIFHLMHKKTAFIFLALFFCIWFFNIWPSNVLSIIPSPEPIFFFYAGSIVAVKKRTPFLFDKYGLVLIVMCIAFFIVDMLLGQSSTSLLYRAGILTGVFAAFYTTKILMVSKRIKSLFLWLGGSACFFVFAMHEPLMSFFQRVVIKLFIPTNDVSTLFFYCAIPIAIIVLSLLVFKILSHILPRFVALITGGRVNSLKGGDQRTLPVDISGCGKQ